MKKRFMMLGLSLMMVIGSYEEVKGVLTSRKVTGSASPIPFKECYKFVSNLDTDTSIIVKLFEDNQGEFVCSQSLSRCLSIFSDPLSNQPIQEEEKKRLIIRFLQGLPINEAWSGFTIKYNENLQVDQSNCITIVQDVDYYWFEQGQPEQGQPEQGQPERGQPKKGQKGESVAAQIAWQFFTQKVWQLFTIGSVGLVSLGLYRFLQAYLFYSAHTKRPGR